MRIGVLIAVVVSLGSASAWAEPLPGELSPETYEESRREALQQKRDARAAIRRNARLLGYSRQQIESALRPTMELKGKFVTRLEDGTEIEFPWFRTGFAENRLANTGKPIDPTRTETNKGGIRLHAGVFAEEVYALALKMDAKLATSGDAFDGMSVRGAKGGIGAGRVIKVGSRYKTRVGARVDPASSVVDRQDMMKQLAKSFRAAGGDVGPGLDIQAGDVNTKAPEMKTLSEAYGSRQRPSAGVSGKAVLRRADGSIDPRGGIEYRGVSTGEGVWMSARLAANRAGLELHGATVVAQGWGEVGRAFGMAAVADGARVIAIQNLWKVGGKMVSGTLLHPRGAEARPAQIKAWLREVDAFIASGQDIAEFAGGRLAESFRPGLDASLIRADIVGVNALGNVLTEKTVPDYVESGTHQGRRKILVEGANLAETSAGARSIDAARRSLLVVPGDLANMGGVHVSNLEAVQNASRREVSSHAARNSLRGTMRSGWLRAMKIADQRGLSERAAIELAAVDAMMKRSLQLPDAPRNSLEGRVLPRRTPARIVRAALLRNMKTKSSKRSQRRVSRAGGVSRRIPTTRRAGDPPPRAGGVSRRSSTTPRVGGVSRRTPTARRAARR